MSAEGRTWSGDLGLVPGRLTFSGRLGGAPAHRHAAVQIVRVERGRSTSSSTAPGPVTEAAGIPTGVRHGIVAAPGARGAITYLDPEWLSSDSRGWRPIRP